ncbi:MAG: tRNA uridine(34) 5-carboxymethylaminomethyl modification radical SAM/GNAT enzyme Elp3 [archaeon]|nr:tRNA uridine(34) 5-carboxymethylaminomethyl modification radical SAM/GNAT enzyme Elp3 [archaeon]
MEVEKEALQELARRLEELESKGKELDQRELWKVKLSICAEYGIKRVPKNSEILELMSSPMKAVFESKLRRKSIRTRSGIAVVTAITKPFDCPHGTCTFCPGGVRFGTPQSYTKESPAASFGLTRDFDSEKQVHDSLEILERNGHDTSKVEMILLGGTILAMPSEYQTDFVKKSYDALNQKDSLSLSEAIKENEYARHRCVGLTIETKPDWCKEEHVDRLLSYGTTRVEIGVQSLRDDVLRYVNRGHNLQDTYDSFGTARDSALKIVAHMMPGLPLSDPDKDHQDLLALINDDRLKPDMLKIYPTLLVEGTALYNQYKIGKYRPYELEEIIEILVRFKRQVPPWLRIMRIQREIPKHEIADGAKAGNLRQLVLDEMQRRGLACQCIRCREIGHRKDSASATSAPTLKRIDYEASGGQEIFLSYEDEASNALYGFLRMRIPSGNEHRSEIKGAKSALVRELHVYGTVVPVGQETRTLEQTQHRGLGSRLLQESEEIARTEFHKKKHVVISASGTREYYRKRGYKDDGAYVSKNL